MDRSIIVAQAGGPQVPNTGPNTTPPKVITVNKPQGDQSITVHVDGSTKLDLSAIANENITLVHVGDRLIIIFDNHAQVTIEPFYGDNGQPLPDLTIDLGPNHDVTAAQFASEFLITTDQSVLPASGGPNSVSSGANFVSFTIDSFSTPTPLPLLAPEDNNGTTGGAANGQAGQQIVPMSLDNALVSGSVSEGGLVTDTIGTTGNSPGAATVATGVPGSLLALVNFGTGGPASAPFQFVSQAAASTWLAHLGLDSHGSLIDTATINGNTLIASTDPSEGTPHNVFSLTINANGSWTFTLLAPLDDGPNQAETSATIDLSGLIQAVDASGGTITLSGDFKITVVDDNPVLTSATVTSGSVEEGALFHAADGAFGDLYGDGNAHFQDGSTATISGTLAGLVSFGADGPASASGEEPASLVNREGKQVGFLVPDGFQFAVTTGAHDFGVTSHGQEVNYIEVTGSGGPFEELTAWTNGGPSNGGHEAFTLFLEGSGFYQFTLINPLDNGPNQSESAATLDLSTLIKAVDFDGSTVPLSGDFKIAVVDDNPVLTSATDISGTVQEGALASGSPGDLFGAGNEQGQSGLATVASGSIANLVSFGADGPAAAKGGAVDGFTFSVAGSASHDFGVTSHGQEVDFVTVTSSGTSQTLTAYTNGGPGEENDSHEVFTLVLNGDGTYTFTLISPIDNGPNQGESAATLDLSTLIQATDFDGSTVPLSGDFQITVTDDAPIDVSGAAGFAGTVNEGGLPNGNESSSPTVFTATTGSLDTLVSFGADGKNGTPFQFVANASTALAALQIHSHDVLVDTASVSGTTLTAYAGGLTGTAAFTLTLNSNDSWTFRLLAPIDHNGSQTFDLSDLVQAVDFDGNAVVLASGDLRVTITDDAPVDAASATGLLGTVNEGGLTNGNEPFSPTVYTGTTGSLDTLVSFGADGKNATPFQFVADAGTALTALQLHSHGVLVDTASVSGTTLTAYAGGLNGTAVFTLTLNSNDSWTFKLLAPIDHNGAQTVDLSSLVQAVDYDGSSVGLASGDIKITITDDAPITISATALLGTVNEGGLPGGNEPSSATTFTGTSGSLDSFVHFGADGQNTTPFQFVAGASSVLADLGLASHGVQVGYAAVTGTTLAAYTGTTAGGTEVFTLTLNASGSWTFHLLAPIDHDGAETIDLSRLVEAVDYDGSAVTLASGELEITITDDAPVLSGTVSGGVDEGALAAGWPGDAYGGGNDQGTSASAVYSGSISGTVSFGADGAALDGTRAAGFQLAVTNGATHDFGVKSLGQEVNYVTLSALGSGAHGDTQTLVGWTNGGLANGGHEVFALTLNGDGTYTFTLINPIDQGSQGDDTATLDLSSLVKAVDYDGSSVALSGDFKINVTDDVPVISGAVSGSVDEGGLTSAIDPYGTGNDSGAAITFSGSLGIDFGADGPAPAAVAASSGTPQTITFDNFSSGQSFTSGNITVTTDQGLNNVSIQHNTNVQVFGTTITVTDTAGQFTLNHVDLGLFGIGTSAAVDNILVTGYNAQNQVIATYTVDLGATIPLGAPSFTFNTTGTPFAGLDVSKVTFTIADPAHFAGSVVLDNLAISTGATAGTPGPVYFSDQATAANNVTVHDANDNPVANLTSHGATVEYALINSDTLVGYTGATVPTSISAANVVFSVTLSTSGSGSYDFVLDKPLDQAIAGEDKLNFTFKYTAQDFDGDTVSGTFTVSDTDDMPVQNTSATAVNGAVDEGGLTSATDTYGIGNDQGFATSASGASGSLASLVKFGADGPDATAFHIVDATAAGAWLTGLGLTSHGHAINSASVSGNTLTALDANSDKVFTLTVNGDGSWTFNLLEPIDQPNGNGENAQTIDLSGLVQAIDYDGDAITLHDLGGTVTTQLSLQPGHYPGDLTTGGVTLNGLTFASDTDPTHYSSAAISVSAQGLGIGSDHISDGQGFMISRAGTDAVSFDLTTDGGKSVTTTIYWAAYTGNTESDHGSATVTVTSSGTLVNIDPTGTFDHLVLDFAMGANDQIRADDISYTASGTSGVFTVTVTDDIPVLTGAAFGLVFEAGLTSATDPYGTGSYSFAHTEASGTLGIDFGADGPAVARTPVYFTDTATAANNVTVTDAYGHAVDLTSLTSHGQAVSFALLSPTELVAYTGAAPTASDTVFTVNLSTAAPNGTYDFVLDQPLDGTGGALHFTFSYTAQDFDGSTASGTFTVWDIDDAPTLTGAGEAGATGIVEEGALAFASAGPGDLYGSGNEQGETGFSTEVSGSLSGLVIFGADGPAETASGSVDGFQFVAASGTHDFGVSSHGVEVGFYTVSTSGTSETLTAYAGTSASGPEAFTLELNGDGTYTFTLVNPIDDVSGSATIDLSTVIQAVDFDGSTQEVNYKITVVDDTPVLTGAAFGLVFEEGLTSATDPYGSVSYYTAPTEASGTLGIDFGADGPAVAGTTSETFDVSSSLADRTFNFHQDGNLVFQGLFGAGSSPNGSYMDGYIGQAITITDAAGKFALTSIDLSEGSQFNIFGGGNSVELVGLDASGHVLATDTVSVGNGLPTTVFDAAGTPFAGLQLAALELLPSDTNSSVQFNDITVARTSAPVYFTDAATAANNVTVTDGKGHAVDLTSLTSHGQAVHFALLSPTELVAYTGAAPTASDTVFTVNLSTAAPNGTYDFVLDQPLDGTGGALHFTFSYTAQDFDGSTASGTFTVWDIDDAPTLTGAGEAGATGIVEEGALAFASAGPGDLYGSGNEQGETGFSTEVSGSLSGLVIFGADGPAETASGSVDGFQFVAASGTHDFGVSSHGVEVGFYTVSTSGTSETLTAYAGTSASGPEAFTLELNGDGTYTFTLVNPIDDVSGSATIDLSTVIQAVDFDGSTQEVNYKITVVDDTPVLTGAAFGLVFEEGLTSATDPYGTGSYSFAHTEASGTLGIDFGADGPAVAGTTSETFDVSSSLADRTFNFHQDGNLVFQGLFGAGSSPNGSYMDGYIGQAITITDAAGKFALTSIDLSEGSQFNIFGGGNSVELVGLDASGHVLATDTVSVGNGLPTTVFDAAGTPFAGLQLAALELLPSDTNSSVQFNDITVARTSAPVYFTDAATAANNVTVTDGKGHAVDLTSLTSHGQAVHFALLSPTELVAYTGAAPTASDTVFTVNLSTAAPNGTYDFVLDQPLDGTGGALHFTFSYTAQDFDGSTASGTFTVWDIDDAPTLTGAGEAGATGIVEEGALAFASAGPGDLYGSGNEQGETGFSTEVSGSLSGLVIFGADGPAETASGSVDGFQFVAASGTHDFGVSSHGVEVGFYTVSTSGTSETLTAYAGTSASGPEAFTLELNGDGTYTFTLVNPIDDVSGSATIDLSTVIQAVDFDGSTQEVNYKITVVDDTPVLTGAAFGLVFEEGLTSATDPYGTGSYSFAHTEASGTLGI